MNSRGACPLEAAQNPRNGASDFPKYVPAASALPSSEIIAAVHNQETTEKVRVALDIQGARSPYSKAVIECADGRLVFDVAGMRLEPRR